MISQQSSSAGAATKASSIPIPIPISIPMSVPVVQQQSVQQQQTAISETLPLIQQQQQQQTIGMYNNNTIDGCWILDKTRSEWSMKQYLEIMNVDPLAIEAHTKGEIDYDTYIHIKFVYNTDSNTTTDTNYNDINREEMNQSSSLTPYRIILIKRSRVNNDLVTDLIIGHEHVEYLPPGDRKKCTVATIQYQSDNTSASTSNTGTGNNKSYISSITISNSLYTMNGLASVLDIRTFTPMDNYYNTSASTCSTAPTPTTITTSSLQQQITITNETTKKSHTTIRYFVPIQSMDHTIVSNTAVLSTGTTVPSLPLLVPIPPFINRTTTASISNNKDTDVTMEDAVTTIPAPAVPSVASVQGQQPPPKGLLSSLFSS